MESILRLFPYFIVFSDGILLALMGLFTLLLFTKFWRFARKSLLFCLFGFFVWVFGGPNLLTFLENRYSVPEISEKVDGIIVLGGSFMTRVSEERDTVALNLAAKRLTTTVELSHRFPNAKIIFSGGVVAKGTIGEYELAQRFFQEQGRPAQRLIWEKRAKNTLENAVLTKELMNPSDDQRWILVTSAFHMPRSVGLFEGAGWKNIIPYPADYFTPGSYGLRSGEWALSDMLHAGRVAIKEMIALTHNWLVGRGSEFVPKQS